MKATNQKFTLTVELENTEEYEALVRFINNNNNNDIDTADEDTVYKIKSYLAKLLPLDWSNHIVAYALVANEIKKGTSIEQINKSLILGDNNKKIIEIANILKEAF